MSAAKPPRPPARAGGKQVPRIDKLRPDEFPGMSRPPSSETLFLFKEIANPDRVDFSKPRPLRDVLRLNSQKPGEEELDVDADSVAADDMAEVEQEDEDEEETAEIDGVGHEQVAAEGASRSAAAAVGEERPQSGDARRGSGGGDKGGKQHYDWAAAVVNSGRPQAEGPAAAAAAAAADTGRVHAAHGVPLGAAADAGGEGASAMHDIMQSLAMPPSIAGRVVQTPMAGSTVGAETPRAKPLGGDVPRDSQREPARGSLDMQQVGNFASLFAAANLDQQAAGDDEEPDDEEEDDQEDGESVGPQGTGGGGYRQGPADDAGDAAVGGRQASRGAATMRVSTPSAAGIMHLAASGKRLQETPRRGAGAERGSGGVPSAQRAFSAHEEAHHRPDWPQEQRHHRQEQQQPQQGRVRGHAHTFDQLVQREQMSIRQQPRDGGWEHKPAGEDRARYEDAPLELERMHAAADDDMVRISPPQMGDASGRAAMLAAADSQGYTRSTEVDARPTAAVPTPRRGAGRRPDSVAQKREAFQALARDANPGLFNSAVAAHVSALQKRRDRGSGKRGGGPGRADRRARPGSAASESSDGDVQSLRSLSASVHPRGGKGGARGHRRPPERRRNNGRGGGGGGPGRRSAGYDSAASSLSEDSDTDAYEDGGGNHHGYDSDDPERPLDTDEEEYFYTMSEDQFRRWRARKDARKQRAKRRARARRRKERELAERRAKSAYIAQLSKMRLQGIPISRDYTMSDDLEEMRLEFERHQSCVAMIEKVETMRRWIGIVLAVAEFLLLLLRIDVSGWSGEVVKELQSRRYDAVLEKLYRKYWKRSAPSPEFSLAMMVLGMLAFKWLDNREKRMHQAEGPAGPGTGGSPGLGGALTGVARALVGSFIGRNGAGGGGGGGAGGLMGLIGSMLSGATRRSSGASSGQQDQARQAQQAQQAQQAETPASLYARAAGAVPLSDTAAGAAATAGTHRERSGAPQAPAAAGRAEQVPSGATTPRRRGLMFQQASQPASTLAAGGPKREFEPTAAESASAWYGDGDGESPPTHAHHDAAAAAASGANPGQIPALDSSSAQLQRAQEEDAGVPARVLAAQAAERRRLQALSTARTLHANMDDDEAALALRRARQITGDYVPPSQT